MMGLAPYGKPIYVDVILEKLINIKEDGSIDINQKYFSYLNGSLMTNKNFADLFGGSSRLADDRITQREMDIACSIQKAICIEKIYLKTYGYNQLLGMLDLPLAARLMFIIRILKNLENLKKMVNHCSLVLIWDPNGVQMKLIHS